MTEFEEMNQRFRSLLRSIENNNKSYFPQPGSIFNSYRIEKIKSLYTIKKKTELPEFIIAQIQAAFLHAGATE